MIKTLPLQISQALFRVCQFIKQKDLRSRIESYGVYLLESASANDFDSVDKALVVLEKFIFLGEDVGEIHYIHAKVLHGQFANLRKAITDEREKQRIELAIADIFAGDFAKYEKPIMASQKNSGPAVNLLQPAMAEKILRDLPHSNVAADDRQEQIAQKIRQLGKAAMKDVVAAFGEVSERTLRYDLQKLCDKKVIERIGNGGPASFYQIKRHFIAEDLIKNTETAAVRGAPLQ